MARESVLLLVFGHKGNTEGLLGRGWSVEEWHAWGDGDESVLRLPSPNDDGKYVLQITLWPVVDAVLHPVQRLIVLADGNEVGSYSVREHTTIELPLPQALTSRPGTVELVLRHPDGVQPCALRDSTDTRFLTLAFVSGGLFRTSETGEAKRAEHRGQSLCIIVSGLMQAQKIADIVSGLFGAAEGAIAYHVSPLGNLDEAIARLPPEALERASLLWEEADAGDAAIKAALRRRLSTTCEIKMFANPRMTALWPFLAHDPRNVPEPFHGGGRYHYGDRIGMRLGGRNLPDDVLFDAYMELSQREMPDLDALLANDIAAWHELDTRHDVALADFLQANFRERPIFTTPRGTSGAVSCHLAWQLMTQSPLVDRLRLEELRARFERLTRGYVGSREELPIHPTVARHFQLRYWTEDMAWRWFDNRLTFRDYILNYIRWVPWMP